MFDSDLSSHLLNLNIVQHHIILWYGHPARHPCLAQLLHSTECVHEVRFENAKADQTAVLQMDDSVALLIESANINGGPRETACMLLENRVVVTTSMDRFQFLPVRPYQGHCAA